MARDCPMGRLVLKWTEQWTTIGHTVERWQGSQLELQSEGIVKVFWPLE